MRLLLVGLNYRPEPVGVGPFTAGLAEGMAARGHRVTVVCGQPYYPHWRVAPGHHRRHWRATEEAGVRVVRCPLHVPARPTGRARLWHHLSFLGTALPAAAWEAAARRPDLVLSVAPSLLSAPVARAAARLAGAPRWLHIQERDSLSAAVR